MKPDTFDMMGPRDSWVESATLPQQIEASKITAGKVTLARYKGTGSIDEAANFTCVAP